MAKPLSPGKSHAEVPKLRQRLGLPEIQEKDNRLIYDTALVEAVKQFKLKRLEIGRRHRR